MVPSSALRTAVGRAVSTPRPLHPFWFTPAGCEIVREIGRGGMSTVYEAREAERMAALKISVPNSSETQLERFASEARIGQKLHHPAIPRTHAYGRFDGGMWMTMELIDGAVLTRQIESTSFDSAARLETLVTIADAVEHVHSHGIIHRDIKPGNIILGKDGPMLVDFGIAKVPKLSLTHPRFVVGTPDYLAPEQVVGTAVDHRVDIFQLGLLAFQLFATRLPWSGESMVEIGWAVCFEKPARISDWRRPGVLLPAKVLVELEAIVARSLARKREQRFESAGAFGRAIAGLLGDVRAGA